VLWVQDVPHTQGAWRFMALIRPGAPAVLGDARTLGVVSRPASASPATGSSKRHAEQQAELVERAFTR
jgi:2-oxoglutarate dehydrogenase E1 component